MELDDKSYVQTVDIQSMAIFGFLKPEASNLDFLVP